MITTRVQRLLNLALCQNVVYEEAYKEVTENEVSIRSAAAKFELHYVLLSRFVKKKQAIKQGSKIPVAMCYRCIYPPNLQKAKLRNFWTVYQNNIYDFVVDDPDDNEPKTYTALGPVDLSHGKQKYNGEYFQQYEGTAMGNSLSPFIANLMSKFETEVKDKSSISLEFGSDNFVAKLNNRFPTIKFTYEVEHNEQLPFLDVLVIRNSENKLEFDVYRKETATLRYIPNDTHHPFQHKMASFNFIIHRLLNFPLSKERFEHDKQLIKNIAKTNCYTVHLIDVNKEA
ncbi:hypothetical protein NQ318_023221 [Aromia moschata]|uniref:Uncharacterized protein n=1 Tax=Aromia moschata TaxID=1265417 RepID=A0AAV8XMT2_9CUCU|nr:hypothetical protein NQ318_023221 [Aromia moschata]